MKSYKTAGTKIETEIRGFLAASDIQLDFGYGDFRAFGQNAYEIRFRMQSLLTIHFYLMLPFAIKRFVRGERIIDEHIDPDFLIFLNPKFSSYQFITIQRDEADVNASNAKMVKKRSKIDPKYINYKIKHIKNKYYYRSRLYPFKKLKIKVFDYRNLEEFEEFINTFRKVDFRWQVKVND